MTVTGPLGTWLWLLRTKRPLDIRQWLWASCVGSKLLMLVANTMLLLAAIQAPSMKEAAAGTLMCCGFYSCNSAHAVYLLRRPRARDMLARILRVAGAIEEEACENGKVVLTKATRSIRRMSVIQLTYMGGMVCSVWAHVLVGGRPYAPMWPPPPLPAPWAERAVGYFEMAAMLLGCLAYFTLITLFSCIVMALTGLYQALSLRVETSQRRGQVLRLIELHQQLNRISREVELFFADIIAHLMVAILVVPLVATLQVVFNVVDALTFMSSSILVSVFLPMSAVSQSLTDASASLSRSAYSSAFSEVANAPSFPLADTTSPSPRALLLVMVSASRPARISLKGLGPVSLSTARAALRVWYQWGNMLVSVAR
ncbi:Odorant receptor 33 [Frankliniella occidentalis]|nr:Odorant receptor 33 [Frankliniella occidentalis]